MKQRHIALEGAHNVRDVGGYAVANGAETRWRRLLRSDSLHRLTADDQQRLRAYGVRTIIDLRLPFEVAHDPNVFAGAADIHYRNIPLITERTDAGIESRSATVSDLYRLMIDECQEPIRDVLAALAEAQAPVLIHCMVGKDRTGLIAALTLGIAGVHSELIADDYALSAPLTSGLLAEIRAMLVSHNIDVARFDRLSPAPRDAMLTTLNYIDARYGGVEPYMAAIGLTTAQRERLKQLLLNGE